MPHLSVISPVYNAEFLLDELHERISKSILPFSSGSYEIIFIDDGSTDRSWEKIEKLAQKDKQVIGIKLSRNFGQHYTITAGLDHAKGEWVVVMDCDLQDRPEEIINLYNKAQEGYDVVLASRHNRKDHFLKKLFSKLFYRTLGYLTGTEEDETIANFGIYHTKVIQSIVSMRESIRYFPTMVKWVGFKSVKVEVEHAERTVGQSGYNIKKLIKLAIDIILAYSDKPIRLLIKTGFLVSIMSMVIAMYYFYKWMRGEIVVMGYSSIIISIWFLSGIIISTLGIVGLYVGKTFEGVKRRPIYIIAETINKPND